ncbi:helix-turn-helix domain-containing protein [Clostridioides difficile]|nr:helix-turn-helix domain-containing protein [Clostridioides difficile]
MAVFRVERNKGYTVMSNHHLRNKDLTLKAKGLLSQMLSLPEDWDYTLAGLSHINRESIDAIRTAVWELEKAGYITRRQGRDEKGKMTAIEYTIYEQPQPPRLENPILENPISDNPTSENPMQLNKDIQKTDLPKKETSNTDLLNTHSIPILSPNPFPLEETAGANGSASVAEERKRTEANDAYKIYEEIIKDNIEYEHFIKYMNMDKDRLDEIVSIMLETVCTRRKTIRIAGDDYPAELVKAKFMKLNSSHIEFVFDCMQNNTTKIRNIKQYLKAVLFNAPNTIDSYYTALVNHDMYGGSRLPD